ncbi:hypothetical protein [Halosimplex salinum]|uniref:hypothetical protein n=1 Tax=Halosimplex salinum TaxID=1710538 RepID=UPI000F488852|nr:hypothetical protein [Halosimplex salinum]
MLDRTRRTRGTAESEGFPPWLRRVARVGTAGFVLANLLVVLAFLTDTVPVPYYSWLSLPVAPLPDQPTLGHYPASYTLGLWLWEFTFPLSILWVADRAGVTGERGRRTAFVGIPALVALCFHAYCVLVFPQPTPTPWEPAVTAVCYVYCQTYAPLWSAITVGTVLLGVGGWLAPRDSSLGRAGTAAFGVLAFPLGVLALYDAATASANGHPNEPVDA